MALFKYHWCVSKETPEQNYIHNVFSEELVSSCGVCSKPCQKPSFITKCVWVQVGMYIHVLRQHLCPFSSFGPQGFDYEELPQGLQDLRRDQKGQTTQRQKTGLMVIDVIFISKF